MKKNPMKITPDDANVTPEERDLMNKSFDHPNSPDDEKLRQAELDNTDEEGNLLNEQGMRDDLTGEDLDVPGSSADDADELIGREDEENNLYSNADTD